MFLFCFCIYSRVWKLKSDNNNHLFISLYNRFLTPSGLFSVCKFFATQSARGGARFAWQLGPNRGWIVLNLDRETRATLPRGCQSDGFRSSTSKLSATPSVSAICLCVCTWVSVFRVRNFQRKNIIWKEVKSNRSLTSAAPLDGGPAPTGPAPVFRVFVLLLCFLFRLWKWFLLGCFDFCFLPVTFLYLHAQLSSRWCLFLCFRLKVLVWLCVL